MQVDDGIEFWTVLQRHQVPSQLVVFPDENHWILKGENSRYFYPQLHEWVVKYLQERACGSAKSRGIRPFGVSRRDLPLAAAHALARGAGEVESTSAPPSSRARKSKGRR